MRLRTGRFLKMFKTSWPITSCLPQRWLLIYRHRSNPVGYEALRCSDSSLIFKFGPSPCLGHYAERLTTIPFADFCSITDGITSISAVGLHLVRSCWMDAHPQAKTLFTNALLVNHQQHVKQISPDKNLYCPCATASFTVVLGSHGFVVLYQLASGLRLI
jgi:hypothetical protein